MSKTLYTVNVVGARMGVTVGAQEDAAAPLTGDTTLRLGAAAGTVRICHPRELSRAADILTPAQLAAVGGDDPDVVAVEFVPAGRRRLAVSLCPSSKRTRCDPAVWFAAGRAVGAWAIDKDDPKRARQQLDIRSWRRLPLADGSGFRLQMVLNTERYLCVHGDRLCLGGEGHAAVFTTEDAPAAAVAPAGPAHHLCRIGDGENFRNSAPFSVWGVDSAAAKKFLRTAAPGDFLWFVQNKSSGLIVAVARLVACRRRGTDTRSDAELGWARAADGFCACGWDTEVHYTDLRNVEDRALVTGLRGQRAVRTWKPESSCAVDLRAAAMGL